jgi:hypothetical protein
MAGITLGNCPICMEEFTGDETGNGEVVGLNDCHHLFHESCNQGVIDEAGPLNNPKCAVCRAVTAGRYTNVQAGVRAFAAARAEGDAAVTAFLNGREPFRAVCAYAANPEADRAAQQKPEVTKGFFSLTLQLVVTKIKAVVAAIIGLICLPFMLSMYLVRAIVTFVNPIFTCCSPITRVAI